MVQRLINFLLQWLGSMAGPQPEVEAAAPPKVEPAPPAAEPQLGKAQDLLRLAIDSTASVAQEVGDHQTTIKTLNAALSAAKEGDSSAVAAVVCQLLLANQTLQGKLERAELKLESHSRQLNDALTASRTDGLTGLLNRRAFDEEVARALSCRQGRGRPAALMIMDVDRFKRFNDIHGHIGGDHALNYVADVLRAHSRDSDIVARYGGEEFVVVFVGSTAAAVCQRAEQVRRAIGQGRVLFEGREARITASAGLADAVEADTVETWLKRADDALYTAKDAGRDCAYLHTSETCERIQVTREGKPQDEPAESPAAGRYREPAAELATEAFADTTFVSNVARRIAEWRRGGSTFSVLLAQIDLVSTSSSPDQAVVSVVLRAALLLARDCVREMDLISRWTEDGLAILLPGAGVFDAKAMARRLREALARCDSPCAGAEQVTMSIGIAEGMEGNDAHRVLQRAWLAQTSAQAAGPGNIFVHDGVKAVAVKTPALIR